MILFLATESVEVAQRAWVHVVARLSVDCSAKHAKKSKPRVYCSAILSNNGRDVHPAKILQRIEEILRSPKFFVEIGPNFTQAVGRP